MKLLDKYKIILHIKRLTYDELLIIKEFIDKEVKKRNKDLINKR